jgi:hypothetical protein
MTRRTNPGAQPPADELPEAHAAVASVAGTSPKDVQALMDQIASLQRQLDVSEEKRTDAEKAALAAAQAQGALMQRDIQEVATGKTVKVKRAIDKDGRPAYKVVGYKDDGREILKPVWREIELPTYFYKVDMPPVGGTDLKISGIPLYHGTVYELDVDTLRTVKDIVYRLWNHDREIHGSDENFYRKEQAPRLSARG